MTYISPIQIAIETIDKEIKDKEDNAIFQAVQNVGITVDKNELLRALKFDRDQYKKGFFEGYAQARKETAREIKNWCDEVGAIYTYHTVGENEIVFDIKELSAMFLDKYGVKGIIIDGVEVE